jgi:hypothetical protein
MDVDELAGKLQILNQSFVYPFTYEFTWKNFAVKKLANTHKGHRDKQRADCLF